MFTGIALRYGVSGVQVIDSLVHLYLIMVGDSPRKNAAIPSLRYEYEMVDHIVLYGLTSRISAFAINGVWDWCVGCSGILDDTMVGSRIG